MIVARERGERGSNPARITPLEDFQLDASRDHLHDSRAEMIIEALVDASVTLPARIVTHAVTPTVRDARARRLARGRDAFSTCFSGSPRSLVRDDRHVGR